MTFEGKGIRCGIDFPELFRHRVPVFPGNRPQTLCRITARGRQRYLDYLQVLEQVVRDAGAAMGAADPMFAGGRLSKA